MVLLIALIAIGIASNPESKVLGLVSYAWAGFGAAFGPVVLISLLWKRMTRNGALAGMLVGAVTVVVWKEFIGLGLYEIIRASSRQHRHRGGEQAGRRAGAEHRQALRGGGCGLPRRLMTGVGARAWWAEAHPTKADVHNRHANPA